MSQPEAPEQRGENGADAARGPASEYWNGVPVPPRPPLPTGGPPPIAAPVSEPPQPERPAQPASGPSLRSDRERSEHPPVPGYIGLPPGRDVRSGAAPVAAAAAEEVAAPSVPPLASTASAVAPLDTLRAPAGGVVPQHPPVEVPVTAPTRIVSPVLHFPDGSEAVIAGGLLLGRDPVAQAATPSAQPVRVHDVARSVSKTHALVTWERGHVWVTDLHSTNGTAVVDDDGFETACAPEVPTPVPSGHSLLLGALRVVVQRSGR